LEVEMTGSKNKRQSRKTRVGSQHAVVTLAIDIGGTGLKATVLDSKGSMLADRVRVDTPYPASPEVILDALVKLVGPLPPFDRISIGFPGVVRDGHVLTARRAC
jgi:polyphosphate glucokinase